MARNRLNLPTVKSGSNRRGLGIQSKLLIMLLGVSIGSTLVVGYVGYASGRDSLRDAAFDQLTSVREAKTLAIQSLFTNIESGLVLDSSGATGNQAAVEFAAAFAELNTQPVNPEQQAAVDSYYADSFIPDLEARTGQQAAPDVFEPTSAAEVYLQNFYTAPPAGDYDAAALVDDAGDGSTWSAVDAKYNPYFRELATRYQYDDALILDTEGNVVYSVYKGVDLGTNILDGPYKGSNLSTAYTDALNSNTVAYATVTDFDRYQPSLGVPTAWGVSPIGDGGQVNGVLAVQLPITSINDVMTGQEGWSADGLGETGESYLVGPDRTMRSVSRLLIDDPETFEELTVEGGSSPDLAQRMVDVNGTVELQKVDTIPVDLALSGKTGTVIAQNYLGQETLNAYAPVDINGVQWVIVSSITTAEAFAPVDEFTRNLALAILAIIVIVSLLSLLLAQVFARPVRTLVGAVRQVAGGDLGVEVTSKTRDEFGDLSVAFNDMSRSLQVKQQLIDEQKAETDRLLLSMMPEKVARRYQEGEETIAENHQDVSVIYADVVGFDEFAASLEFGAGAEYPERPDAPVRRRGDGGRRGEGAHPAGRLPGELWPDRAARRQRPAHRRLRHPDDAHRGAVQRAVRRVDLDPRRHRQWNGDLRPGRQGEHRLRHVGRRGERGQPRPGTGREARHLRDPTGAGPTARHQRAGRSGLDRHQGHTASGVADLLRGRRS